MRVESNACTPCSAGSEIAAGSDATGADTFCTCPANSRVVQSYTSDNTKKYGSTACTSTSDCETKCGSDSACLGYTNSGAGVTSWGDYTCPLSDNVYIDIVANDEAFAVIKIDGSLKVWGDSTTGGSGAPSGYFVSVVGTDDAFAALKADGSIKAWGSSGHGGSGAPTSSGFTKIFSNSHAFAAIDGDGEITAWGNCLLYTSDAADDTPCLCRSRWSPYH